MDGKICAAVTLVDFLMHSEKRLNSLAYNLVAMFKLLKLFRKILIDEIKRLIKLLAMK